MDKEHNVMRQNKMAFQEDSVRDARAVISAASKLLDQGFYDLAAPRRWRSRDVTLSVTPLPEAGVVLTVKPHAGWAGLLRGTSVLLRPPTDSEYPVRFGVLDAHGQLRVTGLPPVPHEVVLHAPWWLDDDLCAEVRDGNTGLAWIEVPVVVLQLPELEEELVAMLHRTLTDGAEWRYLSAAGDLRFTIKTLEGELQVDASLHANDPAGQAAVCYGLLSSASIKRIRKGICSTVFDQRSIGSWWRADSMRCRSVLMLGAHPQPAPPPVARRVALDTRLAEVLSSDSALQRQVAAAEVTDELSRYGAERARYL